MDSQIELCGVTVLDLPDLLEGRYCPDSRATCHGLPEHIPPQRRYLKEKKTDESDGLP